MMVSLKSGVGDVVLVTDETKVTEEAEVTELETSLESATALVVADRSALLVVTTEVASPSSAS